MFCLGYMCICQTFALIIQIEHQEIMSLLYGLLIWITWQWEYCTDGQCQPCYYRCRVCDGVGISHCLQCNPEYVLVEGHCQLCTKNCQSCVTSGTQYRCESCQPGFYLSQSKGICYQCPAGAQLCTLSAIQQCKQGYYQSYGECLSCPSNCLRCSSSSQCDECYQGYYLNNSMCMECSDNCAICVSDTCYQCSSGYEGQQCMVMCPNNCAICHVGVCYSCMENYVLGVDGCTPLGILCRFGSSVWQCSECLNVGYMSGGRCVPHSTLSNFNRQIYITSINNQPDIYNQTIRQCEEISLAWSEDGRLLVQFYVHPSHGLKINFLLGGMPDHRVWVESNAFATTSQVVVSDKAAYICDDIHVFSLQEQVILHSSFNTTQQPVLLTLFSTSSIGLVQMLVQMQQCVIEHCGFCHSTYTCSACLYPYVLENSQCQQQCSAGYYYTPTAQLCSLDCLPTYYAILEDYLCVECVSPCQQCTDAEVCASCVDEWYYYEGQCVQVCPSGYWASDGNNICDTCLFPCRTCENSNRQCTSCEAGYLTVNGSCGLECGDGYFANFTTLICEQCELPCATCVQTGFQCLSCVVGFLVEFQCMDECPAGMVGIDNVCMNCEWPCQHCVNNVSVCVQCVVGYVYNYSCVDSCPQAYYAHDGFCQECQYPCATCLSIDECLSCANNTLYYSHSCLYQCPSTTYPSSDTCQPCHSPCKTCTSKQTCLSCNNQFVIWQGNCYVACPTGTYLNTTTKTCITCLYPCSQCIDQLSCQSCVTYLFEESCVDDCPSGFYGRDHICEPCYDRCVDCVSYGVCLGCVDGYYFSEGTCLEVCPLTYYAENSTCVSCHQRCEICRDGDICLQCKQGYFITQNSTCQPTCSEGFYPHSPSKQCLPCSLPCSSCVSPYSCTQCAEESGRPYLLLHSCVDECPLTYYALNKKCVLCDDLCVGCVGSGSNCSSCDFGLWLFEGDCVERCPDGYYGQSGTCMECLWPCEVCLWETYCTRCGEELFQWNGVCLENCPKTHYGVNGTCEPCQAPCISCQNSSTTCTSCKQHNKYLVRDEGTCVEDCGLYHYGNPTTRACEQCVKPCLTCIDKKRCLTCWEGLFFLQGECKSWCPSTYYEDNGGCTLCHSPCKQCLNSTACVSCIPSHNYFQANHSCLESCPSTHFSMQTAPLQYSCLGCPTYCLTCYDYSACKACNKQSYRPYLQHDNCVSTCSDGYYLDGWSCLQCGYRCVECEGAGACERCVGGYLSNGICVDYCGELNYGDEMGVCRSCQAPCLRCYDDTNCVSCVEGYYLYRTFCLKHCPTNTWSVPSLRICSDNCSYYTVTSEMLCLLECPYYYNAEGQCLAECGDGEIVNGSLGCVKCDDCPEPEYRVEFINSEGRTLLLMVFSMELEGWEQFVPNDSRYRIVQHQYDSSELELSFVSTSPSQEWKTPQIHQVSPNMIALEIQAETWGTITHQLLTLDKLTFQQYPLQNRIQTTIISPPHQIGEAYGWLQLVSTAICIVVWLLVLINLFIDNCRAMFLCVDVVQSLAMLYYLKIWYYPCLEALLRGFAVGSFIDWAYPLKVGVDQYWLCDGKRWVCNYLSTLTMLLMGVGVCCLMIVLGRCIITIYLPNKHPIIWNHINNLYCVFGYLFFFVSLSFLPSSQTIVVNALCLVIFIIMTLSLWYQVVKNIFNGSYKQSSFFWALKKEKSQKLLSNAHYVMVSCRRVFLIVGLALFVNQELLALSITLFSTIFILSNVLFNQPFKIYHKWMVLIEMLYLLVLFGMEAIVVADGSISKRGWQALGWVVTVLVLLLVLVVLGVSLGETVKAIRVLRERIRRRNEVGNEGSQKTSSISSISEKELPVEVSQAKNSKKTITMQEQNKQSSNHESLINMSQADSNSQDLYSDELSSQQKQKMPPKYLIKVDKHKQPQSPPE